MSTSDDLRKLAALAGVCILLQELRDAGLIEGGPKINVQRCQETLEMCASVGIVPSSEEIASAAKGMVVAWNAWGAA